MLRRVGEAVTIVSLLFIAGSVLFGGMYLGIQTTGALPDWAGDIFTAFSGGILALLGTLLASTVNRQFEKRKLEHEQAVLFVKPYRDFLIELYNLLSRKVYAETTDNSYLAEKILISQQEIKEILKKIPPLATNFLVGRREFQEQIEVTILNGVTLLRSEVDKQFLQEFNKWSTSSRTIIKQLNDYENQAYL